MLSSEIKLFKKYLKLQNTECQNNIIGYRSYNEPGKEISVRINFKDNTWIKVYYKDGGANKNLIKVNFKNGNYNYNDEIICC